MMTSDKIRADVRTLQQTRNEEMLHQIRKELAELNEDEQMQLLLWMKGQFVKEQKDKLLSCKVSGFL
jgi:hypothetical protein